MIVQHIAIKGYYVDYKKRNEIALFFFFLFLTLLVMLRHESVGSDTENYINYFKTFDMIPPPRINPSDEYKTAL